jgi:hypothetical protein
MVGFKANRIAHVPAESLPPRLRWLILTDNAVETLPDSLGQRSRLEKLMLAGNRITTLPDLSGCGQLALLRLAANRLETLPSWLLSMPRLAWLALAGNPVIHKPADPLRRENFPQISHESLCFHRVLGEGASGVIHKASWKRSEELSTDVAVKLFKGSMTSDGSRTARWPPPWLPPDTRDWSVWKELSTTRAMPHRDWCCRCSTRRSSRWPDRRTSPRAVGMSIPMDLAFLWTSCG